MPASPIIKSTIPWKKYLILTMESLLAFYISTFSIAMYFMHRTGSSLMIHALLAVLYLFVILVCTKRIIETVSLAALMLIIPIAPVLIMVTVISLIPILEFLK